MLLSSAYRSRASAAGLLPAGTDRDVPRIGGRIVMKITWVLTSVLLMSVTVIPWALAQDTVGVWYTGAHQPAFFDQFRLLWNRFLRPWPHWPRLLRAAFLWPGFLRPGNRSLHRSADPFYLLYAGRSRRWRRCGAKRPISIKLGCARHNKNSEMPMVDRRSSARSRPLDGGGPGWGDLAEDAGVAITCSAAGGLCVPAYSSLPRSPPPDPSPIEGGGFTQPERSRTS